MNITFFIGNGFDVGLGMKSKFKDYFPIYIEESLNKPKHIRKLSESIIADEEDWSYFEKQLGAYTKEFNKNNKRELIEQIKDFEKGFISYLTKQEKQLSFEDSDNILKCMVNGLMKFYSEQNLAIGSSTAIRNAFQKRDSENHIINFVSFNYTRALENCLAKFKDGIISERNTSNGKRCTKIGKILHVHGYTDLHHIMGVNDESQILNPDLASDKRFVKYLVKPLLNKEHRTNYNEQCELMIRESSIICVYGMSLGETDKKWWKNIIDWLKESSERQFIIFDYDENFDPSSQIDWIDKEESIVDKLSSYCNNMDLEALRPRIHIAVHKNIFHIDLIKKDMTVEDAYRQRIVNSI